mmetsp:Transcript_80892/g.215881  ORF Transcript_80892/g.215881 Transcript_80892/m.215881 type:complete len:233 (-) Transcript_80892:1152-1850(-)
MQYLLHILPDGSDHGVGIEQDLHGLHHPTLAGLPQHAHGADIVGVHVGLVPKQPPAHLRCVEVPPAPGQVQRGLPVNVAHVGIGLVLQQQTQALRPLHPRSPMQRGGQVLLSPRWVRFPGQQYVHNLTPPPLASVVQRRAPKPIARIRGVDIRHALQAGEDNGEVPSLLAGRAHLRLHHLDLRHVLALLQCLHLGQHPLGLQKQRVLLHPHALRYLQRTLQAHRCLQLQLHL